MLIIGERVEVKKTGSVGTVVRDCWSPGLGTTYLVQLESEYAESRFYRESELISRMDLTFIGTLPEHFFE